MRSENITLRAGRYRAENTDSVWDAFDITMEVKETEKSYIFRPLDFKSRYAGVHIEMLFKQSARGVLRKDKGGHAVCKWSSEDFTFYPYQAGIPYYFKQIRRRQNMSNRVYYPIDEQSARAAHDMMSMSDCTAGSKTAEYKGYADRAYELAERIEQERPRQAERAWRIARSRANTEEFRELQDYIYNLERLLHGTEVIRSDEEDAIEQLQDKLERLETAQEMMKTVNVHYQNLISAAAFQYCLS